MNTTESWGRKLLVGLVLCGMMAGRAGVTQQQQVPNPTLGTDPKDPFGTKQKQEDEKEKGVMPADMQGRLQQARQTERQKKLVDDTEKLLALATQLHTDVAKTNKDILSVDVIKRADEIERLAHAVKERMKG